MKCSCGSELPDDYKFCGRCGREAQRSLHCEKCGYENPAGNRFCGKCGLRLLAGLTASAHPVDPSVTEKIDVSKPEPIISQPPSEAASERKGSLPEVHAADDVHAERAQPPSEARRTQPDNYRPPANYNSSSSVLGLTQGTSSDASDDDGYYLLDEQPRRAASARAWILLFLLVGASVLGWLEWRSVNAQNMNVHSLAYLLDPGNGNGQSATAPPPPSASPTTYDASDPSANAQHHDGSGATNGSGSGQALNKPESDEGAEHLSEQNIDEHGNVQPSSPQQSNAQQSNVQQSPAESSKVQQSKSKPLAAVEQTKKDHADPLLDKADMYLRAHNCEQGLIYLRSAADQPDAKAQVRMGALYMTGTCVAKDRIAAYQWFSRALMLEPENEWISRNRMILLSQMTPNERRQVE